MSERQIGFVGVTGMMGHGMAGSLLRAGFPLAYALRSEATDRVADLDAAGAIRLDSYAALGAASDVVVICVTASEDVVQVVEGLLERPREGLVIVDSSTVEPTVTRALAAVAATKGVRYADAPLTQGPAQAEAGTLNVIVGADDALFAEIEPVLSAFAAHIVRAGSLGHGHALKLINNFVMQATGATLAEAFGTAAKVGMDPQLVEEILSLGKFENGLLHLLARTLHGDFGAQRFLLDNAKKDVRYYTRMAGEAGAVTGMGSAALGVLQTASNLGFGGEFTPSVVKAQAILNDSEIRTEKERAWPASPPLAASLPPLRVPAPPRGPAAAARSTNSPASRRPRASS